eukprot:TRINITY_DN12555_c0_g1_i1.p1 TRINITY_DN12555_c0_g1~~TRINITY_DN12555_c0_g1_i1.p1  ORF type:complete len:560 (+),score=126.87 TRINITY_DN12555_c0_g1_i1:71-1750(+)
MIRRPPRSTLSSSSAASDVYKRQMRPLPVVVVVVMACLASALQPKHSPRHLAQIAALSEHLIRARMEHNPRLLHALAGLQLASQDPLAALHTLRPVEQAALAGEGWQPELITAVLREASIMTGNCSRWADATSSLDGLGTWRWRLWCAGAAAQGTNQGGAAVYAHAMAGVEAMLQGEPVRATRLVNAAGPHVPPEWPFPCLYLPQWSARVAAQEFDFNALMRAAMPDSVKRMLHHTVTEARLIRRERLQPALQRALLLLRTGGPECSLGHLRARLTREHSSAKGAAVRSLDGPLGVHVEDLLRLMRHPAVVGWVREARASESSWVLVGNAWSEALLLAHALHLHIVLIDPGGVPPWLPGLQRSVLLERIATQGRSAPRCRWQCTPYQLARVAGGGWVDFIGGDPLETAGVWADARAVLLLDAYQPEWVRAQWYGMLQEKLPLGAAVLGLREGSQSLDDGALLWSPGPVSMYIKSRDGVLWQLDSVLLSRHGEHAAESMRNINFDRDVSDWYRLTAEHILSQGTPNSAVTNTSFKLQPTGRDLCEAGSTAFCWSSTGSQE